MYVDAGQSKVQFCLQAVKGKVTAGLPACSVSAYFYTSMRGAGAASMSGNANSCECVCLPKQLAYRCKPPSCRIAEWKHI